MSSFIKLKKKIKKKTATIRRSFRWIHVHPANEHVRKVLVTAALAEAKLADGKRGLVRIPKRMFGEDELHGISALAGLEPVAVLACQRAGFKVMQIGERHDDLPEPAALPATQRWQDTAVLDLVRHHDAGVIHYDANNDVDPVCLVAQAAMAWPEKKIAVVANEVRETRRIRDALNSMGVLSVAANHQNRPSLYIDANGKWNEDHHY